MCKLRVEGTRAVMDCATCPFEMFSAECISSHLKELSTISDVDIKTMKYEEEIVIELDEEKTKVLTDYAKVIRQVEANLFKPGVYGMPEDDDFKGRKHALEKAYDYLFINPMLSIDELDKYKETTPTRPMFLEARRSFLLLCKELAQKIGGTKFHELTKEYGGDVRKVFAFLSALKFSEFIAGFVLSLPSDAKEIPDASYELGYGLRAKLYSLEKTEANLYVIENPVLDGLSEELKKLLRELIAKEMAPTSEKWDWNTIYETKTREYRQKFVDEASTLKVQITPEQANAMAREAANWVVGLGSPIENLSLDRKFITDIFIDSENSPVYIEHMKFGLCHTLWRYNRKMLERACDNAVSAAKVVFDGNHPIADTMLGRLNMRVHLQRAPATFGEIQAALRLTKETPFTYPQYIGYNSVSAFYAGYDDTMVSLGCSEAVLGLKGVGKTAFMSAKVSSISTRRRIIPIQDIEEIPTKAYRKRGFHIATMKVMASDKEEEAMSPQQAELSLVALANASLRMGDAALIINEIRSKTAIRGIVNLLNTQPGVFCLYNLHAQSIKDIQDRLELVFGMTAESMFATDRYSFLKKVRFGRRGRLHRLLGLEMETDLEQRKYVEVFKFRRGGSIEKSAVECLFIKNPEASAWSLSNTSMAELQKRLQVAFVPPALARRCEETGIPAEQYIMQSFFKGKVYSDIHRASVEQNKPELAEIDFVIRCNTAVNKLLREREDEAGAIKWAEIDAEWPAIFKTLLEAEQAKR